MRIILLIHYLNLAAPSCGFTFRELPPPQPLQPPDPHIGAAFPIEPVALFAEIALFAVLLSTTINLPRYMPMEHEKGISPILVGVKVMMFSPGRRVRLIPYAGITKDAAQVNEDVEFIIHFIGRPFSTVKELGE